MLATMERRPDHRPGESLARLCDIMHRLLGPNGCPWDREQTIESLRPYLIEETYEVLEAMETGHPEDHCEELGDLLMQIVFQAALRDQQDAFDIDDVANGISDKLVRRHPHVFADATADSAEEVERNWEAIKAREKAARGTSQTRTLGGVPQGLPALIRAQKISKKAAKVGFDWPDVAGCRAKVTEELGEVDRAIASGDKDAIRHEIGDLLFAVVSLARKVGCDAEESLRGCTRRFEDRFGFIEDELARLGRSPADSDLHEMDELWNRAKREGRR